MSIPEFNDLPGEPMLPLRQTRIGIWVLTCPHTAKPDYDYDRAIQGLTIEDIATEINIDWNASSGLRVYPEFNPDIHVARRELTYYPNLPLVCGWDWGNCYSEDTEVLTRAGWKRIIDVDKERDLVASRDPDSGEMSYVPINFKVVRPYRGDMLEWQSQNIDICVTPEHLMPHRTRSGCLSGGNSKRPGVQFRTAEWIAERMSSHLYVDLTSGWNPPRSPPILGMQPIDFARFLGIYLSEGHCDSKGYSHRIFVSQKDAKPAIAEMLAATGLQWKRYEGAHGGHWYVSNKVLANYLAPLGLARTKVVPVEIKQLGREEIRAFLEAYELGDGHQRKRYRGRWRERTIFTSSEAMADDLQELIQKAGWASSKRWVRARASIICEEGRPPRRIMGAGGWTLTIKGIYHAQLRPEHFRRFHYEGNVVCLNVKHHTLYVRRNGTPSWNGNSPACLIGQISPVGQFQIFPSLAPEEREFEGVYAFGERVADHLLRTYASPYGKSLKQLKTEHYGDPAGRSMVRHTASGKQSRELFSCFQILNRGLVLHQGVDEDGADTSEILPGWGWIVQPGEVSIKLRTDAVRARLRTMIGGRHPALIVDPREEFVKSCFMGGYRRKAFSDGTWDRHPEKNHASHIMDALSYCVSRLFARPGKDDPDEDDLDRPRVEPFRSQSSSWHRIW